MESPIITQCGAISLASLQPPLLTAPPLQPRPATTGALDLMLPLQPKLLPGYLQSSFLSTTLSTVRPPDLPDKVKETEFKPSVDVIIEKTESNENSNRNSIDEESLVDRGTDNLNNAEINTSDCNNYSNDEINSNITTNVNSIDSPNNNSC